MYSYSLIANEINFSRLSAVNFIKFFDDATILFDFLFQQ